MVAQLQPPAQQQPTYQNLALVPLRDFLETQIEIWQPILWANGYQVSNLGRVRSFWRTSGTGRSLVNRQVRGSWIQVIGDVPRLLRLGTDKDGYRTAALRVNGKTHMRRVHRLVLEAFVFNPRPEARFVNHKTNVKGDNRLPNLEWCTQRENEDHARVIGVWPSGVRSGNSKVNEDGVREIRRAVLRGESKASLGRRFGMSATGIGYITSRKHYRDVS